MSERVLVIGAGITGLFTTMYLSKHGVDVVLIDQNDVLSGTSGRFHGMLHSGTRYTTNDPEAARECIAENKKLYNMGDHFIRDTGGYFVALNDDEANFGNRIWDSNKKNGIPTEEIDAEAFKGKTEPKISSETTRVLRVPDRVIRANEFAMSVASESMNNGAKILTHTEAILTDSHRVLLKGHPEIEGNFDCVVNTAGPWAMDVANTMGMKGLIVSPALGYMAVYSGRLVNSIINRMRPPSDGDILVPYGENTILGTIAVITDDPDSFQVEQEDMDMMHEEGTQLVPAMKSMPYMRTYYSSRPLISSESDAVRTVSRDYSIMEQDTGIRQLAVVGGKFSTARLMGEKLSSMVLDKRPEQVGNLEINMNDSMRKFLSPIENGNLLRSVYSRMGTIDEETVNSSMAAMVNYVIESRSASPK